MKDDAVYLHHIAECIRRINIIAAEGHNSFSSSSTLQDATLRNLQTMSEATQRLSDTIKSENPNVEWSKISAFRNVLVHNYLGIDLDLIWKIVENDLMDLKYTVAELLKSTE